MKRLPLISIFALLILTFTGAAFAQVKGKNPKSKSAAPRTVKDFYMRLPVKYFPYLESKHTTVKKSLLKSNHDK